MANAAKALTGLGALAFLLAIVTNFGGAFLATAEGWSRAATNLVLLAIALAVCFRNDASTNRPLP